MTIAMAGAPQTRAALLVEPYALEPASAAKATPTPPPPTIAPLPAPPGAPQGIWLLALKAAVQVYDCQGLLCGRIVWLAHARNADGQLVRDKKNPDAALRQRPLCGQTVLWGLKRDGVDRWTNGWLYNPHDGTTYRVAGQFRGQDTLVVRIYLGVPIFGQTSIWRRVPQLSSEGWC
jgi:uncharacterized protein (DUF2147 family)